MNKHVLPSTYLLACVALGLVLVPFESWRTSFADPCHLATIGGIATLLVLLVTRRRGTRGLAFERRLLAVFLASMPLIYVASGTSSRWLGVELCAVPAFGAIALLGVRRSPWWLVFGIAAHGLLWDSWHHMQDSVVPGWYANGCLLMDVALALYYGARLEERPEAPLAA